MIRSVLTESDETENELSEESERRILEMVEEQLDRPNPPSTKVLYRRAMHFIDRNVRKLTLQQFNAKFLLQVKRKRARARTNSKDGASDGATTENSAEEDGERSELADPARSDASPRETKRSAGNGARETPASERVTIRRQRMRSALLAYAKRVAAAETRADLIEVVPEVDKFVDRVVSA